MQTFFHFLRLVAATGIVCVLLGASPAPSRAAAQPGASPLLRVTSVDGQQCPNFAVAFRYSDEQQTPVNNLQPEEVTVSAVPNGPSLPITLSRSQDTPVAVAIVVDVSAVMGQEMLLQRTRFKNMLERVTDLIRRLYAVEKQETSLITFADSVEVPEAKALQLRYITNALSRAERAIPAQTEPETSYLLSEAIRRGLEQLENAPPEYARALFVFAAGEPGGQLDMNSIGELLTRMAGNPASITVVGLSPELEAQTAALGANYYPFNAQDLDQLDVERRAIDQRFSELTTRSSSYVAQFNAATLPPGAQQLRLTVRDTPAEVNLQVCPVPPRIELATPAALPERKLQLGARPIFAQTPIVSVTYYLDGREIGAAGPAENFRLDFDPFAPAHQGFFEPEREYTLTASAIDQAGTSSRPEDTATLPVTMPAHPLTLLQIGAGLIGLGAVVSIGVWLVGRQLRARTPPITSPDTPPDTLPPGDSEHEDTQPPDDIAAPMRDFVPLRVVVVDMRSDETYHYDLSDPAIPSYDIGFHEANSIAIRRKAQGLSRHHAKLTPVSDGSDHGWELTDTSSYGTYRGTVPSDANRLGRVPMDVHAGDTIWLGKEIKLMLESLEPPAPQRPAGGGAVRVADDGTLPPELETEPPDDGTLPPETYVSASPGRFRPLRVLVHDLRQGDVETVELTDATTPSYDIGLSETSAITIKRRARGVSRNHAKLTPVSDGANYGWELTDTSQYGTFHGPAPAEEHRVTGPMEIQPGDIVWIGTEIKLTFEWL